MEKPEWTFWPTQYVGSEKGMCEFQTWLYQQLAGWPWFPGQIPTLTWPHFPQLQHRMRAVPISHSYYKG